MKVDYGMVILTVSFIGLLAWAIIFNVKRDRLDKKTIVQLRVEEKDIDHDQRFVLYAVQKDGEEYIMNKDRAMTIEEMEVYFTSEMEKLCTK